ncbi:hypothetical protein ACMC9I_10070 [Deinococcota bacterium DY0809b]
MERVWSFYSSAFPLEPDEAEKVNPSLGGKALCRYLKEALARRGVEPSEPAAEDWGWRLELAFEGRRFWMGLGAVSNEPERFLVFLKTRRGLRGLLAGAVWRASFERLVTLVEQALREHPEIRDLAEEPA